MLIFIIAIGAGFATPYAEPHLSKLLKPIILDDIPMAEGEFRTFTFILLMIIVSLLALSTSVSALPVILGGGLGLFGVRLFNAIKKRIKATPEKVEATVEDPKEP
ncbi:MAG: hypothetical protein ACPG5U_09590 [Planktomarina sp.]